MYVRGTYVYFSPGVVSILLIGRYEGPRVDTRVVPSFLIIFGVGGGGGGGLGAGGVGAGGVGAGGKYVAGGLVVTFFGVVVGLGVVVVGLGVVVVGFGFALQSQVKISESVVNLKTVSFASKCCK